MEFSNKCIYSGTSEIRTPRDLAKVSLFRRCPYNSCNIMLYNSGPRTLVCIVEVSVIGGVHFRRFHCIYINILGAVYNHWTGLVDWTGGLNWWTDTKNHFYKTYTRLWSYVEVL